ncbi:mechanosensitive ion channel family protein [bacterium]|nr:mechanosensitive ion channel family protein [bacterium]
MKEWLEILLIEDPAIRMLVQAAVIVVAGYVISKIVHLIVKIIQHRITSKTETDLDDRIVGVLEKSVQRIINVSALYIAAGRIENVYHGKWALYLDGAFFVVMVIFITMLFSGIVKVVMEWYVNVIAVRTQSQVDDELVPLVKRVANMLLYSIGLVICLDHFHIDIKALVVSLGVGSFAIAFAAQETLANMIAGFVIMVDRPFRAGDRIRILSSQQTGDVIKVGLRSTKILDFDNNIVMIPNAQIIKNEIINFSYPEVASRLRIEVGVAYGTDIEKAKKILIDVCKSFEQVLPEPKPTAFLLGFGDSSVNLAVVARVQHYREVFDTSDAVRVKIYDEFNKHGIEFPFPQRVVHIKNQSASG